MGSATRTVKVWFKYRLADYVVDDTDGEILFPFYDAKRLKHDPPLIYGSCFTYSLYSKTTGR